MIFANLPNVILQVGQIALALPDRRAQLWLLDRLPMAMVTSGCRFPATEIPTHSRINSEPATGDSIPAEAHRRACSAYRVARTALERGEPVFAAGMLQEIEVEIAAVKDWLSFLILDGDRLLDKLPRITWAVAVDKAEAWQLAQRPKAGDRGTEFRIDAGQGWYWTKLMTRQAMTREGDAMRHCMGKIVGFGVAGDEELGGVGVWSLRDRHGASHVTVMLNGTYVEGLHGFRNRRPKKEIVRRVAPFVKALREAGREDIRDHSFHQWGVLIHEGETYRDDDLPAGVLEAGEAKKLERDGVTPRFQRIGIGEVFARAMDAGQFARFALQRHEDVRRLIVERLTSEMPRGARIRGDDREQCQRIFDALQDLPEPPENVEIEEGPDYRATLTIRFARGRTLAMRLDRIVRQVGAVDTLDPRVIEHVRQQALEFLSGRAPDAVNVEWSITFDEVEDAPDRGHMPTLVPAPVYGGRIDPATGVPTELAHAPRDDPVVGPLVYFANQYHSRPEA